MRCSSASRVMDMLPRWRARLSPTRASRDLQISSPALTRLTLLRSTFSKSSVSSESPPNRELSGTCSCCGYVADVLALFPLRPINRTRRTDREGHAPLHAVSQQTYLDTLTDTQQCERVAQLRRALHRHAVHRDHDLPHLDTRAIRRGARRDFRDLNPARIDQL